MAVWDWHEGLHPDLITKVKAVLMTMAAKGYPMKVHQGLRTAAYQRGLYNQGRTIPGPNVHAAKPLGSIITNCDGYTRKSRHQAAADGFGHAVDCCFEGRDPFGIKQPWTTFGVAVKQQGLTWGGDFTSPKDLNHVELP